MVNTEIVHAVYAKIENRPGSLEHLAKVLGERRINIDAMSLETVGGLGYARLVTRDAKQTLELLQQSNIDAYPTQLVLTALPNKPRELFRATSDLAAAGLNIESVLTTPEGKLAIRTNNNEMAQRVLSKL